MAFFIILFINELYRKYVIWAGVVYRYVSRRERSVAP